MECGIRASVLVSGMGALHVPHYPELPGLERFSGPAFHSSAWDYNVISTAKRRRRRHGCQRHPIRPAIAPRVGQLHLFQRTPPWIVPRLDFALVKNGGAASVASPSRAGPTAIYFSGAREIRVLGFLGNETFRKKVEAIALRHMGRRIKDPQAPHALHSQLSIGVQTRPRFRRLLSHPQSFERSELVTEGSLKSASTASSRATASSAPIDVLIYGTGSVPPSSHAHWLPHRG